MFQFIIPILAPIATKVISAYITPKLVPVIDKVKEIEATVPQKANQLKQNDLMALIWKSDEIMAFFSKCGWREKQVIVIVNFCVLMVKKPLTDDKTEWNDNDYTLAFEFLKVVAMTWIRRFKK